MFSLYSKGTGGEPLIIKLIRDSGQDPKTFVQENIIRPLINQMIFLAKTEGLIGEPHEQNVLVEMESGRLTGQFYYRDLAGFAVNPDFRQRAGKSMNDIPAFIHSDALKAGRVDLFGQIDTYLLHSNFYALTKAVESRFPEVTAPWVESTSEAEVIRSLNQELGIEAKDLRQAELRIIKYLKPKAAKPSLKSGSCSQILAL